jgi:hypothetical protein
MSIGTKEVATDEVRIGDPESSAEPAGSVHDRDGEKY